MLSFLNATEAIEFLTIQPDSESALNAVDGRLHNARCIYRLFLAGRLNAVDALERILIEIGKDYSHA